MFLTTLFVVVGMTVFNTVPQAAAGPQCEGNSENKEHPHTAPRPNRDRGRQDKFRPVPDIDAWRLMELGSVREELKLSKEQTNQLSSIRAEMRKSLEPMSRDEWAALDAEQRKAKYQEFVAKSKQLRTDFDSKLKATLNEQQNTRVRQIRLQLLGLHALFTDDVAKELNLSSAQQDKIRGTLQNSRSMIRDRIQEHLRSKSDESMRTIMNQVRQEVDAKALTALSQKQLAQYETMKGEKFDISLEDFRRRGRGKRGERDKNRDEDGRRGMRPDAEDRSGRSRMADPAKPPRP